VIKIYSLLKFSINELASHAKPLNVYVNKLEFSDTKLETNDINKYFISVLIFIMSLLILSGLLTISGIELESSFKLAILTLMNTVNSSIHGLNEFNFNELQYFTKYFLILFMIIGRVELLTLLIILKKFLFKN
jgi:trk system potassium uptake protein TrkH